LVAFAVYALDTGRVLRGGTMADEASARAQVNEGEGLHLGRVPPNHYVGGAGLVDMGKPPTIRHVFDWSAHDWKDPRTLDEVRADRWSEIKQQRDALETGGFAYLGQWLQSDERSVLRINTRASAAREALLAGQPLTTFWKAADNTLMELDAHQMAAMSTALSSYASELHTTAGLLLAQISAAATPAEVQAVAWPTTIP
jgi:hypothetical protein